MSKKNKKLNFNKKAFDRSIQNIKKETFLSVSNLLIMVVTFIFLGLFITLVAVSQTAIRSLESQAQIHVFFKDDFSEQNIFALRDRYINDKRIDTVNYVSKAQAYKIFSEYNKDSPTLVESTSESILPASLEIRAKNISDLESLNREIQSIDGVEDIRFLKDVADSFKFWSNIVYIGGFIFIAVFVFISYSIILYTLKSTINSKGMELSVLKLVGASDEYVRDPFVYQGMIFGMISAGIAGLFILILSIIVTFTGVFKKGIMLGLLYGVNIHPIVFASLVMILLMVFGGLLGYFGSSSAVKKYLKY